MTQTCSLERGRVGGEAEATRVLSGVTSRTVVMVPWGRLGGWEGHGWGPRRERARLFSGPGQGAQGSMGTSPSLAQRGRLPWWGVGPRAPAGHRGLPKDTGRRQPPQDRLEAVKEFRVVGVGQKCAQHSRSWTLKGLAYLWGRQGLSRGL